MPQKRTPLSGVSVKPQHEHPCCYTTERTLVGVNNKTERTHVRWLSPNKHPLVVVFIHRNKPLLVVAVVGKTRKGEWRVRASDYGERVDPVERRLFGVGRKTLPEKFSGGGGGVVVAGMLAGEDDRRWRQLGGGRRWSPENFSGGGSRWPEFWERGREFGVLTAKFKAYFEKLENTKVVLERQLARKVDDSKAEKDQFLKEINHLSTQLENQKRKIVETKFDKPLILGKPPADKLLINTQISKSWFTPKVFVQKDFSKSVTAQSLPKNEKDQLLKQIASLESKLASQYLRSSQKEYHKLRTSYNALKVKFDSLNWTKRKNKVFNSLRPKVNVSEKVNTDESSNLFSKRVSQFTTYSLQKDRRFSKKSQTFETSTSQKVFMKSALNGKSQVFETPIS
ncbi:hypothetical protein Tco_1019772 [Tanacetum coccineum]|uniref:Uncharacterized protein n=1 Tax=Tanacetum coccineum TaxID=301880 RepID=A0ABQ5G010_9ASTR